MGVEDAIRIIADTLHPSQRAQVLHQLPAVKEDPAVKKARVDKAKADLAAAEADDAVDDGDGDDGEAAKKAKAKK